ncbi:MAG: ABC transporter ATP-binding protein [bacterium]|nr:ABC transporter ATP-binding protein [bacterium]
MICFEHVSKQLGRFRMNDITFSLPKGYIMGVVGPNGAGKTSIFHLITGLYTPDNGAILINQRSYKENEAAIKDEIGFVFSEGLFNGGLSLVANASLYGKYYSNYSKELFNTYCRRFGLLAEKKLKKCSKGEKLKFQLAFALSHQPKLLVLDEPTASFDPEFRTEFLKCITQFVADGEHSVIMATHLMSDLERIADYITYVDNGKIIFSMEQERLKSMYRMVSGEEYKINLLEKQDILYKESGKYATKALVRHHGYSSYDQEVVAEIPTLEELMYFMMRGEK